MLSFRRDTLPGRVVFGAGRSRSDLKSEVDNLGVRPFVIASQRAEALTKELPESLGGRVVAGFTDVREHVPRETADAARVEGLAAVGPSPDGRAGRKRGHTRADLAVPAVGVVGPATHHEVCHVLGGALGLPHAQTHAVIFPYVARLKDAELCRVAEALGAQ